MQSNQGQIAAGLIQLIPVGRLELLPQLITWGSGFDIPFSHSRRSPWRFEPATTLTGAITALSERPETDCRSCIHLANSYCPIPSFSNNHQRKTFLPMARSATLNPASMPFFPGGGMRITDDDLSDDFGPGISPVTRTEHDRNSSALSTSPSEYRSVRSSPSPPQFDTTSHLRPPHTEELRSSPTFRQVNVSRQYPPVETRQREPSSTAYVESYMEERKGSMQTPMGNGKPTFFHVQQQQGRLPTPPVAIGSLSAPSARTNGIVMSSSPASSMESSAFFTNPFEQQPPQQQQQPQSQPPSQLSFDAQLRASPVIRDIIERLTLCEQVTREVHRGLADVDRKASLLNTNGYSSGQPEFQDPFATTKVQPTAFNTPTMNPRPSISGGIAPHQAAPGDDVSSISQRLNTLTSSVGQLLALQTQQIQQNNATSSLLPNRSLPPITSTLDIGPQQSIAPNGGQNMVGLGMPPRPELRQNSARAPNAPVRTWSASAIDIPMRSEPVAQRPDSRLMDKRRSVSGLLRRESVGVSNSCATTFTMCAYVIL